MLRRLKIGRRLLIGYAVLLILSMITSFLAIIEINNIWNDTKNLYERPYSATTIIKEIKINALNIRRYMLDISLLDDGAEMQKLVRSIDNEERLAIESFKTISQLYNGEDIGLQESYSFFIEWKPLRDEVISLAFQGRIKESSELIVTRNRDYVSILFEKMQVPIDNIARMADEFYQNAGRTKKKIILSLIIVLAASLFFSIIFAYLITKSIVTPLSSIVRSIREIAIGNLNNEKLPEEEDEIGELAASFNRMQDDLLQKGNTARRIAEGDFSARVRSSSENDMVADAINMIGSNFDQVVKQAMKVADGDFRGEISGISVTNPLTIVITRMLESLREVVAKARKVAQGDFSGEIIPKSESDELAFALNRMTEALRDATQLNEKQSRLKTAQNELNETMRGDLNSTVLAKNIITFVSKYTKAQIGAIYIYSENLKGYQLMGSYAFTFKKGVNTFYRNGESLVGQAAMEKRMISFSELPDNYVKITSGLGDAIPRNVIISPFVYEDKTIGLIELGSVQEFSNEAIEFLNLVMENIAVSVMSAESRTQMAQLLEVTRTQAEEMQVQQEELRQANEELETQTVALKKSEESLQLQQEELRVTNEELEDKTRRLEEHKEWMEKQNRNLEKARQEIEQKARELEITNRYKSEFLANMSHELRTPLNSLLLLSQSLMDNKSKNLTSQQIESARIIYNSGNDLLNLINDILDLSRIESGKMYLTPSALPVSSIESSVRDYFSHVIDEKGLKLTIDKEQNVPAEIVTDETRLNQVIRNIMSNAIKFTEKGSIDIKIFVPDQSISENKGMLSISIKDTGIGIPYDRQQDIFEAFHQVDGTISRRYSGSGLGLSITRELVKL